MGEFIPTNDGRPLKTQDAMLEHINRLHVQRRSAIRQCLAFKALSPDLVEYMDWILNSLEVTERELERA